MVLRMDSPAPPIKVENWLRGQPLTTFESGKIYIVEFWATWCRPCVAAMPHLIRLQETYKDSGVEVIGIAAAERAETVQEARTKLETWLNEKFSNLNYRIGFDSTGEMNRLWMEASFSVGIPTSFVLDRDGRIAFIGHPEQLNDVLPKVLDGSWRTSDEGKTADSERIAESERKTGELKRKRALIEPILAKLRPAMKAEDWAAALSAVKELVAVMPGEINFRVVQADLLLHKIGDIQNGVPVMRQLVRDAIERNSEVWMAGAMRQLFDPANDNSQFPQAERFAIGKELSEHILKLDPPERCDGPKFLSYGAVAQYHHEIGQKGRAIALVEVALKSLDGAQPIPDELKHHARSGLLQALADYKGQKACHGMQCALSETKNQTVSNPIGRKRKQKTH
ncbi:TlpA disulfide reductase family protein [Bradyrhizobium sp. ARR65]|uniref:TlpA disulfide reductase family protein n=1 Tax=Bradyrhizobium sp. ARR65 TaxID=1040989 RepID=UPI000464A2FF|nr:TlpA disulfide reductase family protein [Bradyrhizobium sp. ARR65]